MALLGITCLRDDGPYCAEWIAHHLAAGFDHFLVLSHDCADGSDALLDALTQSGQVTHLPFSPKGNKSVQWQALALIAKHPIYQASDWALFFDVDEFLCLPDQSLTDLLTQLSDVQGAFDALALPWRLFGSSGLKDWDSGITPERFRRAAPHDLHFPLAHLFKTLHRPEAFQKPGVHRPRGKPNKPARWLGPDGLPLPSGFAASDAAITLYGRYQKAPRVWLNHYSLRSEAEFVVKRARGLPNHASREIDLTYWAERNWNTCEANEIAPMLAATKDQMQRLLDLPGVMAAHSACCEAHRSKLEHLMQEIDTLRLRFRLGFLEGSRAPTAEEGRAFLTAQIKILSRKGQA